VGGLLRRGVVQVESPWPCQRGSARKSSSQVTPAVQGAHKVLRLRCGMLGEDEDGGAKGHAGKRARGGAARAQRTADKNRQAQKRYRERQSARVPYPSTIVPYPSLVSVLRATLHWRADAAPLSWPVHRPPGMSVRLPRRRYTYPGV